MIVEVVGGRAFVAVSEQPAAAECVGAQVDDEVGVGVERRTEAGRTKGKTEERQVAVRVRAHRSIESEANEKQFMSSIGPNDDDDRGKHSPNAQMQSKTTRHEKTKCRRSAPT